MGLSHKKSILENPAIQRLGHFVREHRKQWDGGIPDLEQYERELHERMMDIECELMGEELARYDVSVKQIEVTRDVKLHVTIQDDGNGFDVDSPSAGHYGLRGMRERALASGGDITIDSKIGSGTIILFSLLLPRE